MLTEGSGVAIVKPRGAMAERPEGKSSKVFDSLPGSAEGCQRDAGGRMATVLHDEPSTGGGGMVPGREGFPVGLDGKAEEVDACCRIARARLRLAAIRWR